MDNRKSRRGVQKWKQGWEALSYPGLIHNFSCVLWYNSSSFDFADCLCNVFCSGAEQCEYFCPLMASITQCRYKKWHYKPSVLQMCTCVCMSGVHMLWFHINFSLVKMLELLELLESVSCLRLREVPCSCATVIKLHIYLSVNHLLKFSFEKYLEHWKRTCNLD